MPAGPGGFRAERAGSVAWGVQVREGINRHSVPGPVWIEKTPSVGALFEQVGGGLRALCWDTQSRNHSPGGCRLQKHSRTVSGGGAVCRDGGGSGPHFFEQIVHEQLCRELGEMQGSLAFAGGLCLDEDPGAPRAQSDAPQAEEGAQAECPQKGGAGFVRNCFFACAES
jgi:hypothetical protein